MLLNICLLIILLLAAIVICGIFLHKDIFTKILFLNSSTSIISLFICLLGSIKVNSSYLDIAIIYFLLSFVTSNAYLKYFLHKHKKQHS
ncbi:MAG: cation:proton antiporter [Rickettsiaceae bacterium]|nr:cation:proton antiporter [Rickettsiaceae bacterium]